MVLGEKAILAAGEMGIDPFEPKMLKQTSYSFRLGPVVRRLKAGGPLDLRVEKAAYEEIQIGDGWVLEPGAFVVAPTLERLKLSASLACFFVTRSSLAQVGLDVVQSSAYTEPECDWTMAMEIGNQGTRPVVLYAGLPCMKGIFCRVE